MTKDQALDLALEALDDLARYADTCELFLKETHPGKAGSLRQRVTKSIEAIAAIKQARALDKMAENARELGLDYEPDYKVTVVDDQHPNGVPLEQWGRPAPDLQAELDATNRQVEILSDALAESRREVAALKAVQEPVALQMDVIVVNLVREGINKHRARELAEHFIKHTTPHAAQRQWVGLSEEEIDKLKHLIDWTATWSHGRFAYEIEQLLKEKNA